MFFSETVDHLNLLKVPCPKCNAVHYIEEERGSLSFLGIEWGGYEKAKCFSCKREVVYIIET